MKATPSLGLISRLLSSGAAFVLNSIFYSPGVASSIASLKTCTVSEYTVLNFIAEGYRISMVWPADYYIFSTSY